MGSIDRPIAVYIFSSTVIAQVSSLGRDTLNDELAGNVKKIRWFTFLLLLHPRHTLLSPIAFLGLPDRVSHFCFKIRISLGVKYVVGLMNEVSFISATGVEIDNKTLPQFAQKFSLLEKLR